MSETIDQLPSAAEVIEIMKKNDWVADVNPLGMWVVGPEDSQGVINALGMGRNFVEAFQMARRSNA